MASTRKSAVRSAAAPVRRSANLAVTPAGHGAATEVATNRKAKVKPKLDKPVKGARQKEDKDASHIQSANAGKAKKPKLLRDSFTIPKTEYAVVESLKARAVKLGKPAKKSELLRAGIKALASLPDLAFVTALNAVPTLKTGRPAKA